MNTIAITRRLFSVLTALAAAGAFIGCSSENDSCGQYSQDQEKLSSCLGIKIFKSEKLRDTHPEITGDERTQLANDENAFAVDLYKRIVAGSAGESVFLSPYSIYHAVGMTYAGAKGATAEQIKAALHFSLDDARLHPAMNDLSLTLEALNPPPDETDKPVFVLNIANSLWVKKDYSIESAYLDTLAVNYGAGLYGLDFSGDPEGSRQVINRWVSAKTNNKINDLLPSESIDGLTRLVLTNAVYFYGKWESPFKKQRTEDEYFHLLDGGTVTVPMMRQSGHFDYFRGEKFQALRMAYKSTDVSMLIILPEEHKFNDVEGGFSSQTLTDTITGMNASTINYYVHLTMPRFELEMFVDLSAGLLKLGMTDAFDPDLADFSGIKHDDPVGPIFIKTVLQKTFIRVDEEGTEAAAATAGVAGAGASGPPPNEVDFTMDRPFIYAIRHDPTGAVLFIGRMMNPAD